MAPFRKGRDYSTVDGRIRRKCYWTRASCGCGRLQIGEVTQEVEFLSIDYTNPNTNPKMLTTLALTLADHHDAFEIFCAPVFCDFLRNYSCTVDGAVVTSLGQYCSGSNLRPNTHVKDKNPQPNKQTWTCSHTMTHTNM